MATVALNAGGTMTLFIRRFIGALVLDPVTFEDVESDRKAGGQAALVVLLACIAAGFAAMGSTSISLATFAAGMIAMLGAWVVWAMLITTIGTILLAEPQTSSKPTELLRTMGFAAAPGVFIAFGAMRAAAPFAFVAGSIWMIAATVLAVRQALDYKSLARAVVVCVVAWFVAFGLVALGAVMFTRPVS